MSLHSFCILALLLSSRTLQVGHSMDGLFCNTRLRSTCGSKVHRVPFISPLLVLLGQQRLVSQLLSLINTPVDKSERMNEELPNPAWILFFRHLCNTEALWGSWLSLEVPLWVPARQVWGASLHGIRKQRVDATCPIYLKKKKSPFYVFEVKSSFPELMLLHLYPTITWFALWRVKKQLSWVL